MIIKKNIKNYEFVEFDLIVSNRNQNNIFKNNLKSLGYRLEKASLNKKDRLHKLSKIHIEKYKLQLSLPLGEFILNLKSNGNPDYKLYLNKYGDKNYCEFSISDYESDKGLYCYVINDKITYIGRSKKTFKERFYEYGKITPYNCLIDGQATNCKINSLINDLSDSKIKIGIYIMNEASDKEISLLEKEIIKELINQGYSLWNKQVN